MEFDENTERKHLVSMIAILLERGFAKSSVFDHMHMSAGEGLGGCLYHFGVARQNGALIELQMPKDWILNKVRNAALSELPALSDVLDVLLSFEAQYGMVPTGYRTGQKVRFTADVSELLRVMELLDKNTVPNDQFLLRMVNHFFLKPENGAWDERVAPLLRSLARETWGAAPNEYRDVLRGKSKRPLTWAEGYLSRKWRYGIWLSKRQSERALDPSHPALPNLVTHTLAENSDEPYVAPGYRR